MSSNSTQYLHIAGANTGVLVAGPSSSSTTNFTIFNSVVVNASGGTGSVITIYDGTSTSGELIAKIDASVAKGLTYTYNVPVSTGVYVVTTGSTLDCTVICSSDE